MGLKIKRFEEIFRNMVTWTTSKSNRLTDFSVGSAVRSLLEGVTYEIEQFYFSMYSNVMYAVENSSFEAFGFARRAPQPAFGDIVVNFTYPTAEGLRIPAGTRFGASIGDRIVYFVTEQSYDILTGSTEAVLEVVCEETGTVGNVPRDTIRTMVHPMREVETLTNPAPFLTGEDEETPQQRKERFNTYVSTLSKGTRSALEYGVLEIDKIAGCYVDDSLVGVVDIYAHDRNGNLSQELIDEIQNNLINYRTAGIQTRVHPIERTDVLLGVRISVDEQYRSNAQLYELRTSLERYLNSFRVGEPLYLSALIQYIRNFDQALIRDVKLTHPTEDLIVDKNQLIRADNVIVEYPPAFEPGGGD